MRILGWLVMIALALVAGFAALNWTAFMTPTTLSVFAFEIYAPLGGIMLGALAVLTLLAVAFAASWRTSMLLESRRLTRELAAQRELAERAEASRVAELGARIDALDASLRQALGVIEHSLLEPASPR